VTPVVSLLACATAAVFGAPLLLRPAGWQSRHPQLALGLWCTAFGTGLVAAGSSLGWAIGTALASPPDATSSQLGLVTTLLAGFAWTGLAGVGAIASLVMTRAEPLSQEHRGLVALCRLLVHDPASRHRRLGSASVVVVASRLPFAVSLPGAPPQIVLTSRLEEDLAPGQLRAVIEHERAHLAHRHAWIARVARLNAACLPRLAAAREFERAVRLLVELIADDHAARVCGAEDVVGALAVLAAVRDDEGLALRARRIAAGQASLRGRVPGTILAMPDLDADSGVRHVLGFSE
jgi:Zn-dependent protease with chaperone function